MTFHLYGFIIGCAVILGSFMAQYVARLQGIPDKEFEKLQLLTLLSGFLGARLWHVFTDFSYYSSDLLSIFAVWRGGLSIIGAGVGVTLSLFLYATFSKQKSKNIIRFLDCVVFGLPLAQMVGRWGNYWNQELYGAPTALPWKLLIDPIHRLSGYEKVAFYHPLFAYEIIALGIFAGWLWWQFKKKNMLLRMGTGVPLAAYVHYYSMVRFLLDFLRIDTAYKIGGLLGVNQVVCIIVFITSGLFLLQRKSHKIL